MSTSALSLDARLQRAVELHRAGAIDAARQAYAQILAIDPNQLATLQLFSSLEFHARNTQAGLDLADRALALMPTLWSALFDSAVALQSLERDAEALDAYERALKIAPGDHRVLLNRDVILQKQDRGDQSLATYESALAAQPANVDLLADSASILAREGRLSEAVARFEAALKLAPGRADIHYRRGDVLRLMNRLEEALKCFQRAVELQADNSEALHDAGGVLQLLGRTDEAIQWHRAAAEVRARAPVPSTFDDPTSQVLWCQRRLCDWAGHTELAHQTLQLVQLGKKTLEPFVTLSITDDPEIQSKCAKGFAEHFAWARVRRDRHEPAFDRARLRIGYLSSDFQQHATSELIVGLIEAHSRSRFEIVGYSYGGPDTSAMRQRLVGGFDSFHDLTPLTDLQAARKITTDGIDILVDLKGYTSGHRFGIAARRPAPLIVHYLGFPGTLGTSCIDYLIGDSFVIPPGSEAHYSEAIARLPHVYQANDCNRAVGGRSPSRLDAGLPESGVVFCGFNQNYKITPAVFDCWMRILQQAEGSVLWLLATNWPARNNLRREASNRGIAPDRLIFADFVSQTDHLARLPLADLFLDTWPVCAHTSAADALWMGLPILTHPQRSFASRVAGSLLNAIGLPELIASDIESYERIAVSLARDSSSLAALRTRLEENRRTSRVFDTNLFAKDIERVYETMWQTHLRGEPPKSFDIT